MNRPSLRLLLAWAVLFGAAAAGAAREADGPEVLTGRAMGTGWTVKYYPTAATPEPSDVERLVADRLEELEAIFSTYRTQSVLSAFNAVADTSWCPVPPELARVAAESRRVSELTGGAFDVTVFPLVRLWGFAGRRRAEGIPAAEEVAAARQRVDWHRLEARLSPPALRKLNPNVAADFSSMAKGFASDQISELLRRIGAPNHLVQVGGDMKTGGAGAGEGWHAAVEQPLDEGSAIACVVVLTGEALSTSGDYRNFFQVGRRRYGHIIDPRTGQPPATSLASVSVLHSSCALSSALATGLYVLGPEDGFKLAVAQDLACVFLVREGTKLVQRRTPEFERRQR